MTRILLLTETTDLIEEVLRLAAAAGLEVDVAADVDAARRLWREAPLVLVGQDALDRVLGAGLPRRDGVLLLAIDIEDSTLWQRAVSLGVEHVAYLPEGESWFVDRLLAVSPIGAGTGTAIGVIGGRGGAGATTLATALAVTSLRRGLRTMLVDTDPYGGGIDLTLGCEGVPGPRWADLATTNGPLTGADLASALPRMAELTVLAWSRGSPERIPSDRVEALLRAARRGCDLVVVDLPRSFDEAARVALGEVSTLLVVVPAELRACVAASRVVDSALAHVDDVRVVARGPAPSGITGDEVASAVGAPLAGWLRPEPHLAQSLERGEPPASSGKGPLARLCRRLLDTVVPVPAAGP